MVEYIIKKTSDMSKIPFAEKIPKVSATQESPRSGGEKTG